MKHPHIPNARRHLLIPDCQVRPGVDTRHIGWAAQAIVDYLPDVIVVIGDWWDFPSLNSHVDAGSLEPNPRAPATRRAVSRPAHTSSPTCDADRASESPR